MEILKRLIINNGNSSSYRIYLKDSSGKRFSFDTPQELSDIDAIQKAETIIAEQLIFEEEAIDDGTYKVKLVSKSGNEIEIDGRVRIEDMPDPGEIDIILDEIPVFIGKMPKKIKPIKEA